MFFYLGKMYDDVIDFDIYKYIDCIPNGLFLDGYMDIWIYGCMDVWIYGYIPLYMYVCLCVFVYKMYMCACIYLYIYVHVCENIKVTSLFIYI